MVEWVVDKKYHSSENSCSRGRLLLAALATPNLLLPGDSASPVPRMTVNLHEQSSNISRPVNYGAQPSV